VWRESVIWNLCGSFATPRNPTDWSRFPRMVATNFGPFGHARALYTTPESRDGRGIGGHLCATPWVGFSELPRQTLGSFRLAVSSRNLGKTNLPSLLTKCHTWAFSDAAGRRTTQELEDIKMRAAVHLRFPGTRWFPQWLVRGGRKQIRCYL
jgi:hypothetical protein